MFPCSPVDSDTFVTARGPRLLVDGTDVVAACSIDEMLAPVAEDSNCGGFVGVEVFEDLDIVL